MEETTAVDSNSVNNITQTSTIEPVLSDMLLITEETKDKSPSRS